MQDSTHHTAEQLPSTAAEAVLVKSEPLPKNTPTVRGPDFNQPLNLLDFISSYKTIGFQATHLGQAIEEINRMLSWRLSDEPISDRDYDEFRDPEFRKNVKCTIFLGFTSNQISSGNREVLKYLFQHNLIRCAVTTGGAIEEDIMKCLNPHFIGSFSKFKGRDLRLKGQNRIGNLIVPNKNYCDFEDWVTPLLDEMLTRQKQDNKIWTPSDMIDFMGEKIDNKDSILYWAHKNKIPIFCPAITDGSIGDMIYFMSYRNPGLIVDIAHDIRRINDIALKAKASGMIILGGGLIKHHICNANLMRNGANFSVFVNTGQEYDGSDSGARPDEAISWGKIRIDATPVKVYAEATLVFPLIVAATFVPYVSSQKSQRSHDISSSSSSDIK